MKGVGERVCKERKRVGKNMRGKIHRERETEGAREKKKGDGKSTMEFWRDR